MKWKAKPEKPKPKIGDIRLRNKFCLFPCHAPNGYVYWLQTIAVREIYTEVWRGDICEGYPGLGWVINDVAE